MRGLGRGDGAGSLVLALAVPDRVSLGFAGGSRGSGWEAESVGVAGERSELGSGSGAGAGWASA